jgi:hypothetical protein
MSFIDYSQTRHYESGLETGRNRKVKIYRLFFDFGSIFPDKKKGWPVSDDTVMHIATAEALLGFFLLIQLTLSAADIDSKNLENLFQLMAAKYIESAK